jgi:hypothetical protein
VVTNHFLSRPDAAPRGDSLARWTRIGDQLQRELDTADRRLSIDEAWAALAAVERGGRRFGTLHSVVFRKDPWVCELRLGIHDAAHGVGAAPSRGRRFRLSMAALFADPHPADAIAGAR